MAYHMGPSNGTKGIEQTIALLGKSVPAGYEAEEWDIGSDILIATFQSGKATKLDAYAGKVGRAGASNIRCAPFRS